MKRVEDARPVRWAIIGIGLVAIAVSVFFVSTNLLADIAYRKVLFKHKPNLKGEKVQYYEDVLSNISQASNFSPSNKDYYLAKAGILLDAVNEGMQKQLHIYMPDIEKYYTKARELNPADFSSYLHLGLLYAQQGDGAAEKMLLTGQRLCPECYLIYAELSNYYFKRGEEAKGFFCLLQLKARAQGLYLFPVMEVAGLVSAQNASRLKDVSLIGNSGTYTIHAGTSVFDFKKEGFPHLQVPVKIKVYTKKSALVPTLYHGYVPYTNFIEMSPDSKKPAEYSVFGASLDNFPQGIYLDDFRIETNDNCIIDKVEVSFAI